MRHFRKRQFGETMGFVKNTKHIPSEAKGVRIERLNRSDGVPGNIASSAQIGIVKLDSTGLIISANRNLKDFIRNRNSEDGFSFNREIEKILCAGVRNSDLRVIDYILKGNHVYFSEIEYLSTSGEKLFFDISSSPIFNKNAEILEIIVFFKEVASFSELNRQFMQSQKIEAIGRLTSGVAHDFNNLLTIISGQADLASFNLESQPHNPALKSLKEIQKATARATNLTKQLLDFTRNKPVKQKRLNLNQVLKDLQPMITSALSSNIKLNISSDENLYDLDANTGQIEQVIMNLVINARDAMPEGGVLTIETLNITIKEHYEYYLSEMKPGLYVMLAISDTGVGMTDSVKAKAFEPFFTAKENGKGTGIGLSTVYGIVKQCNGHIWLYSEPNQGATLKIYFPAVGVGIEAGDHKIKKEGVLSGSETVLIVDDEEAVCETTKRMLKRFGYEVLVVHNGKEAIELCELGQAEIDLLFVDVGLPDMNGYDLVEQLKRKTPDMKVLVMSGYLQKTANNKNVVNHNYPFIQKPFKIHELASKIRFILSSPLEEVGQNIN